MKPEKPMPENSDAVHPEDKRTPAQRFDDAMSVILTVPKKKILEIEKDQRNDPKKSKRKSS
jgi:hypothetical protein